jgi:hypothetical protein
MAWCQDEEKIFAIIFPQGEERLRIDERDLLVIPELAAGVVSYELQPETLLIRVLTQDGRFYEVDPVKLKIVPPEKRIQRGRRYNGSIYRESAVGDTITRIQRDYFRLWGEPRRKLTDGNLHPINTGWEFLLGWLLEPVPSPDQLFVVSYHTLEKKEYTLTGMSLQGEVQWQVLGRELKLPRLPFSAYKGREIRETTSFGRHLILVIGGSLVALDRETGKQDWTLHL